MMSRNIVRRDPWSIFEELLQPVKYGPRVYESDVGTKDNPTLVTRGHWVERRYRQWRDPDGSYHEELVSAEEADDIPEVGDNYGGTD